MSNTIADLRKGVEFVTPPCSPTNAITAAVTAIHTALIGDNDE